MEDIIKNVWPDWTTVGLIGKGSFGAVYEVKKEEFGYVTYSAVKIVEIPQNDSEIESLYVSGMDEASITSYYEDMLQNFMGEIKTLESMKGAANIVSVEDYKVVKNERGVGWKVFVRMELLTGLNEYLKQNKTMSTENVVQMGKDICEALAVCHKFNIIHREVKVENFFIDKFGKFKLGDFGAAKQLENTMPAMPQKGINMYMAPEVSRGENYENTADIYSLGIAMYRLLNNGRFPFEPPRNQSLAYNDREQANQKRLAGQPFPGLQNVDNILNDIIMKACAFAPGDRYSSAGEMLADLGQLPMKSLEIPPLMPPVKQVELFETPPLAPPVKQVEPFETPPLTPPVKQAEPRETPPEPIEETGHGDEKAGEVPPTQRVCAQCGREIMPGEDECRYCQQTAQQMQDSPPPEMPMQWYKSTINAFIPLDIIWDIGYALVFLFRIIFDEEVYLYYPHMKVLNILCGAGLISLAVWGVFIRRAMIKLKKNSWKHYCNWILLDVVLFLLYEVFTAVILTDASALKSDAYGFGFVLGFGWEAVNWYYFKKRAHLFVN